MRKALETLKTVFLGSWTPAEKALLLLNVLLFGVLLGWVTAPLRNVMIHADCDIEKEEEED